MRLSAGVQGLGETIQPGIVGRQAEAQEIAGPIETAAPDMILAKDPVERSGLGMSRQSEQGGAANDRPSGFGQNCIQFLCLVLQGLACASDPRVVAQCGAADSKRGSGTWPWAQRCLDRLRDLRRRNREAQTQARETEEFSERPQNDHRQFAAQGDRAHLGIKIGEGFVNHEPSAAVAYLVRRSGERRSVDDAAVRVVGIDDHGVPRVLGDDFPELKRCNGMAGLLPGRCVLAVGRTGNGRRASIRESRQPLDQRLRARCDDDIGILGNTIGATRGGGQRGFIGVRRQPLPDFILQLRDRPRPGIDPGRKIEPHLWQAAVMRNCFAQVAAMLHGRFMPFSVVKRERIWWNFAAVVLALMAGIVLPARAADLPRVASINLCTDQLLMTLADPDQILGLSPYSRDKARSWAASRARAFPRLSGEAEDVLALKPDLVVAGRYTKRATRELLKQQGLKVAEFDIAKSIDDVKSQMRRMGDLVNHPDRAEAQVAKLDAAIARAKQEVARKPYRVLALSRRGWVSGDDSVTSALLSITGLSNAASGLGVRHGGFAKLETIVALKPDFILVSDGNDVAEDEGRALLLHPALEKLYPPSRRIVIPEDLTVCGGPMLPDALDRLIAELKRVGD